MSVGIPSTNPARPAPVSVVDEGADVVEFLFNRFARYLLPKAEKNLPPAEAVEEAMKRNIFPPHQTRQNPSPRQADACCHFGGKNAPVFPRRSQRAAGRFFSGCCSARVLAQCAA